MKIISGSDTGDLKNHRLPIVAIAADVQEAHIIHEHSHRRGQLLFASNGCMQIRVRNRNWYISPQYAVWVNPHTLHSVRANAQVAYRSLYIDTEYCGGLSLHDGPLEITPLLRDLILEATKFAENYTPHSAEARLISVMHDRLRIARPARLQIPLPGDKYLLRLCDALLHNPADDRGIEEWASWLGISSRTLTRKFHREMQTGFSKWRQLIRVSLAIERIMAGESVTTTAMELGYSSPAAFTAMFKQITGLSPREYLTSAI